MKRRIFIITLSFLVICYLFTMNCSAQPWKLLIKSQGQGYHVTNATIGMDTDTNNTGAWPVAPSMPNFSSEIKIIDQNIDPNNEEYGEIIKLDDSVIETWTLDVTVGVSTVLVHPSLVDPNSCLADPNLTDPNSCFPDPNSWSVADASEPDFFPELFWDSNDIDAIGSDHLLQLRLGGPYGMVLVDDMKTTTSYQTSEGDASATGYYNPESNMARMRYAAVYRYLPADETQSIMLSPGWNWVSFNALPDDISLESFFGDHVDDIEQVKTQTRSATNLLPPGPGWIGDDLNLMSKISDNAMFKIKVRAEVTPFTLNVTGLRLPSDMTIQLQQNWTWISYLPGPDCLSVEEVVSSIMDVGDFFQIKSQTQSKTNIGGTSLNLIGDLTEVCPGQGYVVKMNAPGSLIYP